jgi:hypothetical protein
MAAAVNDSGEIKAYRKKPVEVQAVRWTGGPESADPIIDWILTTGKHSASWTEAHEGFQSHDGRGYPAEPECIRISTMEGTMRAEPGDWVIRGVEGEFDKCEDSIFREAYEPVAAPELSPRLP